VLRIHYGVKQHDRPVGDARQDDKPKKTEMPERISNGSKRANANGKIDRHHHLIIDRIMGLPFPPTERVEKHKGRNPDQSGKCPKGYSPAEVL